MKLLSYKIDIDGVLTPISELSTGTNISDLNGNPGYIAIMDGDTIPENYEDITTAENWAKYKPFIIGKGFGVMDWKAIRREIKTLILTKVSDNLNDNWGLLTAEEKNIVCIYLTNIVPSIKFVETFPVASERGKIAQNFDLKSIESRTQRIGVMRMYLMGKIGSKNGLKYLKDTLQNSLIEMFLAGIEEYNATTEEPSGLFDFIKGTTGTEFETATATGLKIPLVGRTYQIVDGSGDDLSDVASDLCAIGLNGYY